MKVDDLLCQLTALLKKGDITLDTELYVETEYTDDERLCGLSPATDGSKRLWLYTWESDNEVDEERESYASYGAVTCDYQEGQFSIWEEAMEESDNKGDEDGKS